MKTAWFKGIFTALANRKLQAKPDKNFVVDEREFLFRHRLKRALDLPSFGPVHS